MILVRRSRVACTGLLMLVLTYSAACTTDHAGRHGRTLVAAIGSDPGHLNPAITTNGSVQTAAGLLYNGLVTLDDSLRPHPELAARWEVLDGGASNRFHLRRNVRWHDGQPLTSADLKFTFDSLLLTFHSRTRASLGPSLLQIDTPDDSTVVFRFRQPFSSWPSSRSRCSGRASIASYWYSG